MKLKQVLILQEYVRSRTRTSEEEKERERERERERESERERDGLLFAYSIVTSLPFFNPIFIRLKLSQCLLFTMSSCNVSIHAIFVSVLT